MEFEQFQLERVRHQIGELESRNWLWWSFAVLGVLIGVGGLLGALWLQSEAADQFLMLTRGQFSAFVYILGVMVAAYHLQMVLRSRELLRVKTELLLETLKNEITRLQGMVDPLTRVYNRQSMEELLNKWIQRSERYDQIFSLAVVDLDFFKEINDRYGHLTGDFVLSEVAQILRSSVRGSDLVIRYGGDEFLLVLSETDKGGTVAVLGRIRKLVDEWNQSHSAAPYKISVSMGYSVFEKGMTARHLISSADQDMYAEKQQHAAERGLATAR